MEIDRSRVLLPRAVLLARILALLALIGVGLNARVAYAGATVSIVDKSPKEEDGRWKLKMTINYGSAPHVAHVPMVFEFVPTVHYERALTDQSPERPILNRIPLQNQQPINESMDVGFSDGTGKIFPVTKFDFVLRRDRGFEAGEYELKITTSEGTQIGQKQKITLQGDNPIIDRRAIVFTGEKKKDKKADEGAAKSDSDKPAEAASQPASPAETPPDTPPADAPPPVPPKQGGCGCRLTPDAPAFPLPVAALALALFARRRRRAA